MFVVKENKPKSFFFGIFFGTVNWSHILPYMVHYDLHISYRGQPALQQCRKIELSFSRERRLKGGWKWWKTCSKSVLAYSHSNLANLYFRRFWVLMKRKPKKLLGMGETFDSIDIFIVEKCPFSCVLSSYCSCLLKSMGNLVSDI